tara:strand:+ start:112 stop:570 length:459 start_codon:yes stop_codon:yes gene_type:complete
MAHFAKLDSNNIVTQVIVVNNAVITDENGDEQEALGVNFLRKLYKDGSAVWKQTSYNTKRGKHYDFNNQESADQTKAFRKNYAGAGFKYDEARDAFIPQIIFDGAPLETYPSWTLNEDSCTYEPPTPYPGGKSYRNDGDYKWNEENRTWDLR